jgi:hypothetical protein
MSRIDVSRTANRLSRVIQGSDGYFYPCTYCNCPLSSGDPCLNGIEVCNFNAGNKHRILYTKDADKIDFNHGTPSYMLVPATEVKTTIDAQSATYYDTRAMGDRDMFNMRLHLPPPKQSCMRMQPCQDSNICCPSQVPPIERYQERLTRTYVMDDNYYRVCTDKIKCVGDTCASVGEKCHDDVPMYKVFNRNAATIAPSVHKDDVAYIPKAVVDTWGQSLVQPMYYADTHSNVNIFTDLNAVAPQMARSNACIRMEPCIGTAAKYKMCCASNERLPPMDTARLPYPTSISMAEVPIVKYTEIDADLRERMIAGVHMQVPALADLKTPSLHADIAAAQKYAGSIVENTSPSTPQDFLADAAKFRERDRLIQQEAEAKRKALDDQMRDVKRKAAEDLRKKMVAQIVLCFFGLTAAVVILSIFSYFDHFWGYFAIVTALLFFDLLVLVLYFL